MPRYTAIVSLLAVAFYFFVAARVAVARGRFEITPPATSGPPEFERAHRVQMNTLEWMPAFLVPLWIAAFFLDDATAALLGLVWIAGRVLYFLGYSRAAEQRLPGFVIQTAACIFLFGAACYGVLRAWPGPP